jgi:Transcriptional regulators
MIVESSKTKSKAAKAPNAANAAKTANAANAANAAKAANAPNAANAANAADKEIFLTKWSALLHRMGRVYHECIDTSLWQMGVSKPIMEALLFMHEELHECEPSVLADAMHVPRQTMTSMLDTMEEKKLIVREPHHSDRRKKIIRLSKEGKDLSKALHNELRRCNKKALALLSDDDGAKLIDLLTRYCEALEKSMGYTPKKMKCQI